VRPAHLETPGRGTPPGRYGHQAHRRPAADPVGREEVRCGPALRHGGGHGQTVRLRGGDGDRAGRGPYPRRFKLLYRVRRRTLLPRRPADDRRRGHQRDPTQRHRGTTRRTRRTGMTTAPRVFEGIAGIEAAIGEHVGYSSWMEITQERVDAFADAT